MFLLIFYRNVLNNRKLTHVLIQKNTWPFKLIYYHELKVFPIFVLSFVFKTLKCFAVCKMQLISKQTGITCYNCSCAYHVECNNLVLNC